MGGRRGRSCLITVVGDSLPSSEVVRSPPGLVFRHPLDERFAFGGHACVAGEAVDCHLRARGVLNAVDHSGPFVDGRVVGDGGEHVAADSSRVQP